ncbi:hypothetical protein HAX54_041526 [Datura stramonium]|uniref:Bet v I/Major latex protein domain-containing protein n=1 Tax=Datura stramonium TaxID=4076 RepID=A0ABS8RIJ8_DATST|nr:hypothetical protein [Datura stramonium]
MSLKGKLVSEINIKCVADVFHDIFRYRQHDISSMCPDKYRMWIFMKVNGALLVKFWKFIHDGTEKAAKHLVKAIDEKKKKLIKVKVIGGDILEEYKSFFFTVHVESKGEENLVTWIMEYEKKNVSVPDPHTLMELCLNMTKDIETYRIK